MSNDSILNKEDGIKEILSKPFSNTKIGIIIHTHQTVKPDFNIKKDDIANLLGDEGIILETFSSKDIYHALAEFRFHQIPVVGFIGDNRSIHLVITAMIELHGEQNMPLFIPFRGRHKSIVAGEVNLDKDIGVIINRIKRLLNEKPKGHQHNESYEQKLKYIQRNTLKVTVIEKNNDDIKDDENKIEVYYGFLFGFGSIYRLMKLLYDGDSKVANSVKSFSRTYLSILFNGDLSDHLLSKDRCSIKLDGERINFPRSLITLASPLDKLLDNYQPFSNSEAYEYIKNSTFNFLTADLNRGDVIKGLPFFIRGKYGKLEKEGRVVSKRVSSAEIETNAGFLLDGELIKPYSQKKSYLITLTQGPVIKFPVI